MYGRKILYPKSIPTWTTKFKVTILPLAGETLQEVSSTWVQIQITPLYYSIRISVTMVVNVKPGMCDVVHEIRDERTTNEGQRVNVLMHH